MVLKAITQSMANLEIINDWLNSGSHSPQEPQLIQNPSLFDAIHTYFEHFKSDEQLLEPICNKLYSYYRSNDYQLIHFCLSFIPTLIGVHIMNANNCTTNECKNGSIDVLLLGVYNLEVVDSEGQLIGQTFRLMSLSKPSIYHELSTHSSAQNQSSLLTEHNISKLDNICGDINVPLFGPHLEVEQIVANNRMDVMTVLMKVFNHTISSLSKQSLFAFCRMCLRLLRQGSINISAEKLNSINLSAINIDCKQIISRNTSKIALSSQFLVEITNSIYFCLYNDVTDLALEALEEIHNRAVYQLFSDVLLMTNAIRNSLLLSSGQPSDGPMGINVALSPTSSTSLTTTGISKIAITNASFKTRKLPDDIPIVVSSANTTGATNIGSNQLLAINEETEEVVEKPTKSGAIKGVTQGIGKMAVIQKLKEIKDKKKDSNVNQKGSKYKSENGDIVNNKLLAHEDSCNEYGSDTSGISDTKLSFSEETIPLNVLNSNKTYFEANDDENSDSSQDSSETSKVPLVLVGSDSLSAKHNTQASVNV